MLRFDSNVNQLFMLAKEPPIMVRIFRLVSYH